MPSELMVDVREFNEGRRLHPRTLIQRLLLSVPAIVLLMLPLLRGANANPYMPMLYVVLAAIFTIPPIVGHYLRFRYWIHPSEVVIRSGLFTVQHRNIPVERIQNIGIERSLLARMLGIAKVTIETAGGQSAEGVLEYVSLEDAVDIRALVQSYKRLATGDQAEEPAEADAAEVPPLYALTPARVLLSGVFRFSLLYVIVIFSGIQYLGIDAEQMVDWFIGHQSEWMNAVRGFSPFVLALTSLGLVTLLSWVTGIVINLNRYFRFELRRSEDKLQMRRGLFTIAERTIPLRRVQALVIRTNPLMKSFGWYALEAQTMGVEGDRGGRAVVVPIGRMADVETVITHIMDVNREAVLERVSRVTVRRITLRLAIILVIGAAALSQLWDGWWALAGLLPFILYYAISFYRTHGFAVTPDAFLVRRGVFREDVWIVPAEKFQVFFEDATYFQRRLGIRSVMVDVPGAGAGAYPAVRDVEDARADQLLADLDAVFRSNRRMPSTTAGASTDRRPPAAPHP